MKRNVMKHSKDARDMALHVCGVRDISWAGWKVIFWNVVHEVEADRIGLLAAGVTFWAILALFPALSALVSLYGLLTDPRSIGEQVTALSGVLPDAAVELLQAQLATLVTTATSQLSMGLVISVGLALWSVNAGTKSLIESLNAVYGEVEKRSFVRFQLVGMGFTLGAIVMAIIYMIAIAVVPIVLAVFGFEGWGQALIKLVRWPILLAMSCMALSMLGRYGVSRRNRVWQWLSVGSLFTVGAWLLASAIFSFYLAHFATYDKTYGSLGAAVGVMVWAWISTYILLLGAEINAEIDAYRAKVAMGE